MEIQTALFCKHNVQYREIVYNQQLSFNLNDIEPFRSLWSDPGIQEAWKKQLTIPTSLWTFDLSSKLFNKIEEIVKMDYVPSVEDVLIGRYRTSLDSHIVQINEHKIEILDTGGERCERKKRTACEYISIFVFVVDLTGYNCLVNEDDRVSHLVESLKCDSKWSENAPIYLAFNFTDILAEKLSHAPLNAFLEDYKGDNSHEDICKYLQEKFTTSSSSNRKYRVHFISSLDTDDIKKLMECILDESILQKQMDSNIEEKSPASTQENKCILQ